MNIKSYCFNRLDLQIIIISEFPRCLEVHLRIIRGGILAAPVVLPRGGRVFEDEGCVPGPASALSLQRTWTLVVRPSTRAALGGMAPTSPPPGGHSMSLRVAGQHSRVACGGGRDRSRCRSQRDGGWGTESLGPSQGHSQGTGSREAGKKE